MTIKRNGIDTGEPIRSQRDRPTTMDIAQICDLYGCRANCGHHFWSCATNDEKIFTHRVCDGEADCTDESDETGCNLGCCNSFRFLSGIYEKHGIFNNKDMYYSIDTELYLYYQSGYWLFSKVQGSLHVVNYAVSSVRCVSEISDFFFYDWEFEEWIGGTGPVECLIDDAKTGTIIETGFSTETSSESFFESTVVATTTPDVTTTSVKMIDEHIALLLRCNKPENIANGAFDCPGDRSVGTNCMLKCEKGYEIDCKEIRQNDISEHLKKLKIF